MTYIFTQLLTKIIRKNNQTQTCNAIRYRKPCSITCLLSKRHYNMYIKAAFYLKQPTLMPRTSKEIITSIQKLQTLIIMVLT
ncbi:hypothetical protein EB796_003919 [Bugula neritina]|uniref:Uncharacterized protein n=1 Tax=Bugula neritina TaxID=10212 RepID=A0A7J7KGH8_BUGNE|nr:hypothetical protein EB796_003919 [Bugula neritina]